MTAREVFEKQEELRFAEDSLRALAYAEIEAQKAGALVSSGDYLKSPEGRAVEALRAEVEAAQDEVGGVVYRIPSLNMGVLREKLDKLAKRASKLDVGGFAYYVDDEVERVESKVDPLVAMAELGYIPPKVTSYRFVVLNARPVKLAGWVFLATLTVESGGVMVSKVPAFARAWSVSRETGASAPDDAAEAAAQEVLDAMNLGVYADESRATLCEHCGLARKRTKTYLVEHVETGEIKQVGSNCLKDFLGVDPHTLIRYAQYLADIVDAMDEEEGFAGGGGGREVVQTEDYLTHVATLVREVGWIGSKEDYKGRPTAGAALSNYWAYTRQEKDKLGRQMWIDPVEADEQRAAEAIAWAKDVLGAKVHQAQNASDFERNMYVAANGDVIPSRSLGVLAYVLVAHARYQEREIERAEAAKQRAASEYVGEVGKRIKLTLKVTRVIEHAGNYGTTFITGFVDESGNEFTWFGSYELDRGESYTATWTVKKHDEYKGTKQTTLNRPSGLEQADAPERDGTEIEADLSEMLRRDANGEPYKAGTQVFFPEGDSEKTYEIVGFTRGTTALVRRVS
jgi:hypothetical protein